MKDHLRELVDVQIAVTVGIGCDEEGSQALLGTASFLAPVLDQEEQKGIDVHAPAHRQPLCALHHLGSHHGRRLRRRRRTPPPPLRSPPQNTGCGPLWGLDQLQFKIATGRPGSTEQSRQWPQETSPNAPLPLSPYRPPRPPSSRAREPDSRLQLRVNENRGVGGTGSGGGGGPAQRRTR